VTSEERLRGGVVRLDPVGIEYRFERMLGVGGVEAADVLAATDAAAAAAAAFRSIHDTGRAPGLEEPVLWPRLGQALDGDSLAGDLALDGLESWADRVRRSDAVVSVGIGGSYLGNRVLRDGLLGTLWNDLPRSTRDDRPELHFAGYHLDPLEARALVEVLRARTAAEGDPAHRVEVLAISKSGTTTETLAATLALLEALDDHSGTRCGFTALTARGSVLGELAARRDGQLLPFPEGIGGRFSVLSPVGLSTAAATGIDVRGVLAGARAVRAALLAAGDDPTRNPALLYALLHHLHAGRGRSQAVFMPYADRLKALAEWYVQLLAESLGKAEDRQGRVVHAGRTPIVAVGTTDMHAQTQLHQEGPLDKTVTTVDVADGGPAQAADRVPDDPSAKALAGKSFAELNTLARLANEEALASSGRPSDAFVLDRLTPKALGGVLYLLMASVAYEGELLDVNAYDQPGVEAYKKIMKRGLASG